MFHPCFILNCLRLIKRHITNCFVKANIFYLCKTENNLKKLPNKTIQSLNPYCLNSPFKNGITAVCPNRIAGFYSDK